MNWHVIPNSLSIGLGLAYYAYAVVTGVPAAEIIDHTTTAAIMFVLFVICWIKLEMPAGIAKLMTVAFLWFDFWTGVVFVFLSMFPCGIAGLAVQRFKGYPVS